MADNVVLNLNSKLTDVAKALEGDWGSQTINGWNCVSLSDKFELCSRPLTANVRTELPWAVNKTNACIIAGNGEIKSEILKIGDTSVLPPINGIGYIISF